MFAAPVSASSLPSRTRHEAGLPSRPKSVGLAAQLGIRPKGKDAASGGAASASPVSAGAASSTELTGKRVVGEAAPVAQAATADADTKATSSAGLGLGLGLDYSSSSSDE